MKHGLGSFIDAAIAPFAPGLAVRRTAARMAFDQVRQYDAAQSNRRTSGWRRPSTSADAENARGLIRLRDGAEDLYRNNKYARAGVDQMVAHLWGDGIAPQFEHDDPKVAQKRQDYWNRWAESKVDGFGDWYGTGRLDTKTMIVRGESLNQWEADDKGPDGRVYGLEGDYLDATKTLKTDKGRIIQGVEFVGRERAAYWLFDEHPGDVFFPGRHLSRPTPAQHIDHIFERTRWDQTRGVSWLAAVALPLRDIGDIEDAVRLKKKVEACVGMVITPPDGSEGSALAQQMVQEDPTRSAVETMSPGMIVRLRPGETMSSLLPSSTGDGVEIIRQQLAAVSANMVPYFLLTGDTSQANYSSLRAGFIGQYARLDDVQQNVLIPLKVRPAVDRIGRRQVLETGDRKLLECRVKYVLPVRRSPDPLKDLMAEVIEIRAGLKLLAKALGERGINAEEHMLAIKSMNDIIDKLGLALETDPRRLTDSGVLQLAAGYIAPKGDKPAN